MRGRNNLKAQRITSLHRSLLSWPCCTPHIYPLQAQMHGKLSLILDAVVCSIVNEAFNTGWPVTRWIPAGVGVYVGFLVLAPRCHALGKARGYMTVSELLFDRFSAPSSSHSSVSTWST